MDNLDPFPLDEVELRLGYPVAVANELPLRQGETLRIPTLRQLELDLGGGS